MADITYKRTFTHLDWIDNKDVVRASGEKGFNQKFHDLEAEFDTISTVVGKVDQAIDQVVANIPDGGLPLSKLRVRKVDEDDSTIVAGGQADLSVIRVDNDSFFFFASVVPIRSERGTATVQWQIRMHLDDNGFRQAILEVHNLSSETIEVHYKIYALSEF